MLQNITIGQFYPTDSLIHKLDPRSKIVFLIALIVLAFLLNSAVSLGMYLVLTVVFMLLSGIPISMYLKNLKSIWFVILLTGVLNVFYVQGGTVYFKYGVLVITQSGVNRAVFMALRIMILIILSAMLTYTTTPTDLTDGIESLMYPLTLIGLKTPVHIIAMMMTIALRFIPTLIDEANKIINAQKSRGADFESGNIIKKVKALIPILIPLLISSIKRALELSEAMESRCYTGDGNMTKYKVLKFSLKDLISLILIAGMFVGVIFLNNVAVKEVINFAKI